MTFASRAIDTCSVLDVLQCGEAALCPKGRPADLSLPQLLAQSAVYTLWLWRTWYRPVMSMAPAPRDRFSATQASTAFCCSELQNEHHCYTPMFTSKTHELFSNWIMFRTEQLTLNCLISNFYISFQYLTEVYKLKFQFLLYQSNL